MISILLFTPLEIFSQQTLFIINGKEYRFIDEKWFSYFKGVKGDEAKINRVIVKIKNNGKIQNIDFNSLELDGIEIVIDRFLNCYHVVKIPKTLNPFASVNILQQSGYFEVIGFDLIGKNATEPNDALYAQQWNLTKIGMPYAWDITTGISTIILGLIDSGIKFDHPDLIDNVWVNPSEDRNSNGRADFIPIQFGGDLDGVDNDSNGKVDDLVGWDFINNDKYPEDIYGHGTNSIGVVSAKTNNKIGIAGIVGGWGNQKGINYMVLKSYNEIDDIYLSTTVMAIEYGAKNNAKILLIEVLFEEDSTILLDAIKLAVNDYGATVVCPAGNKKYFGLLYPAKYNEVISVGATRQDDVRWSYSSFGAGLDVMAPSWVPPQALIMDIGVILVAHQPQPLMLLVWPD